VGGGGVRREGTLRVETGREGKKLTGGGRGFVFSKKSAPRSPWEMSVAGRSSVREALS